MDPLTKSLSTLISEAANSAADRVASQIRERPPSDAEGRRKNWLTNREAQEYLGLSKATLARYRADGTLPFSKVGQSVYYRLEAIEGLLTRNEVLHPASP